MRIYIFIPPHEYLASFSGLSHVLLYTNFQVFKYNSTRSIFVIPDDDFDRWKTGIQPHSDIILLSTVYSFHTMEFTITPKIY